MNIAQDGKSNNVALRHRNMHKGNFNSKRLETTPFSMKEDEENLKRQKNLSFKKNKLFEQYY
jgi:hypothetical protein